MFLGAISLFGLLCFVNYRFGRSIFFPAFVFSTVWAVDLCLLAVSGKMFYPIIPETLILVAIGASAFSFGSFVGLMPPLRRRVFPEFNSTSNRIINWLLFFIIVTLPFYYRWLTQLTGQGDSPFLLAVRLTTQDMMGKSSAFTFFGTVSELSRILAMMCFWEREKFPKRAILAIAISFLVSISTGQKSGPLLLAVSLIGIDWFKTGHVRWKLLAVMALIMLTAATAIEFYVHIGGGSFGENIGNVFDLFILYASGGIVGFDQTVRHPNIIPNYSSIAVVFMRIARKLGSDMDVPEVPEFVNIGPNSLQDNAFTMYWTYLDLGYAGMLAIVAIFGFLATIAYRLALQGRKNWILLYSTLLYSIIFSIFTDYFVAMSYFFLKIAVVSWCVYALPVRLKQLRGWISETVRHDLAKSPLR
jgi:oligosaccharide repeat unit polymerase